MSSILSVLFIFIALPIPLAPSGSILLSVIKKVYPLCNKLWCVCMSVALRLSLVTGVFVFSASAIALSPSSPMFLYVRAYQGLFGCFVVTSDA